MLLTSSCSMIPGLKMPDSWKSLTGSKTNSVVAAQKVDENVKQLTEADKKVEEARKKMELDYSKFINDLQKKHPGIVSIKYIGESQKGKAIPFVVLNKKSNDKKLRVFLQGGLHGDEMASSEGVLFLMEKLLIPC